MFRTSISIIIALAFWTNTAQCSIDHDEGSVYLVYAGPYSTSPSSVFGHLFLLMQPSQDLPVPLWDVISFNAETHDAGPLRFFFIGITGGFLGSYMTVKFHQKVREYEVLENRDLWMVRLRISELELTVLEESLARYKGIRFPYTFFSKNCAYYLQHLLAEVLPEIPQPSGAVSPVEVISLVETVGRAEESYHRPAISRRLADQVDEISPHTLHMLRESSWDELMVDHDWLKSLSVSDRIFVQEYIQWKVLQRDVGIDIETRSGIELMRALNAQGSRKDEKDGKIVSAGSSEPLPDFHGYGKLTASTRVSAGRDTKIGLRYRPALHGLEDSWHGYRPLNTLEFLTVEIVGTADRPMSELEEFILFSQRSLTAVNWIETNTSWMLEASVRRRGLFGSRKLQPCIMSGLGYAGDWGNEIYAHLLLMGMVQSGDGIVFAPGFQAGLTCLSLDRWRGGVQVDWFRDIFSHNREYGEFEAWLRRDLNDFLGITLHFRERSDYRGFSADLSYYW